MSAFLVTHNHITTLITAGLNSPCRYPGDRIVLSWYHDGTRHQLDHVNADTVGRMLWEACWESVSYRYPNTTNLPGPIGLTRADVVGYTYRPTLRADEPVEVLKAIHCYEYQSCEHPGWDKSEAQAFCRALEHRMITRLPGYDDAPWGE